MYPIHENESGSFQELARSHDLKFGQLSYLIISPNCTRGNHYHTRKEEWFCCIRGRCEIKLTHVKTKSSRSIIINESCKKFIKVNPFENHIVYNPDPIENCELLIIISEEYDEGNPDTFNLQDM